MENIYLKVFVSLMLVLCLIGVVYIVLRYILQMQGLKYGKAKQIFIEEIINIDHKRRLALCSFRDKKYVILLGQNDLVVDVINEKI